MLKTESEYYNEIIDDHIFKTLEDAIDYAKDNGYEDYSIVKWSVD
jgi:hypothetical protein